MEKIDLTGVSTDDLKIIWDILKPKIAGDPWEETEDYIRSGHGSTDCDRMRTKTIDEEKGIKAIICFKGESSSIQSFLFSKEKGWTMEKAKEWFAEHKGDAVPAGSDDMTDEEIQTKIEELREQKEAVRKKIDERYAAMKPKPEDPEITKLYEQLEDIDIQLKAYQELRVKRIVEGEADCAICKEIDNLGKLAFAKRMMTVWGADAFKVLVDEEEGEREKAKAAQKARSEKYGIGVKEGGNVTKPSEYEHLDDDQFADPVNYRYPIDAKHVMAAWAYISKDENQSAGGYSDEEWAKMKAKVKAAMKKHGHEVEGEPAEDAKLSEYAAELIRQSEELIATARKLREQSSVF